jgi:hypothetical protein
MTEVAPSAVVRSLFTSTPAVRIDFTSIGLSIEVPQIAGRVSHSGTSGSPSRPPYDRHQRAIISPCHPMSSVFCSGASESAPACSESRLD